MRKHSSAVLCAIQEVSSEHSFPLVCVVCAIHLYQSSNARVYFGGVHRNKCQ